MTKYQNSWGSTSRFLLSVLCGFLALSGTSALPAAEPLAAAAKGLNFKFSVAPGVLNSSIDGRVVLLVTPVGEDPFINDDVTEYGQSFGKNVFKVGTKDIITLAGGSNDSTETGVFGWSILSLNNVAAGDYTVRAFLKPYTTVTRGDGSVVSVHFPCGDGAPNVNPVGSLTTPYTNISVTGGSQTISLAFTDVTAPDVATGDEIGGCSQGNYADTALLKYLKIRSKKLSRFWNRDMYVGANILLPYGYNASDKATRYPVVYSQGHWPGDTGPFNYPNAAFSAAWNNGTIVDNNGTSRPAPKMIMIRFRHETAFYDDSYAVNTANIGPYGDALNDELIPAIDKAFNTIAEPYARILEGGSTGGWESIANLIFRPDLFAATFTSYPDSLDFHRHQDIHLYDQTNAYIRDGQPVISIRTFVNNTQVGLASVAQENHWELTFGTASRSYLQWDVWNAVFGVQGYNNYPLEPWDKVTGEIDAEAVQLWKPMDLSNYVVSNWNGPKNLGQVLKNRIFVYVGTYDTYFLNEGVQFFQNNVESVGGPNWANFTYLAGQPHGGNYQRRTTSNYLEFLYAYIQSIAPNGTNPLPSNVTVASSRGNQWDEVRAYGGRKAAVARQAAPSIKGKDTIAAGTTVRGDVGRWDPGVALEAQWAIEGAVTGKPFKVMPGDELFYTASAMKKSYLLQLWVTGSKRNYVTETRESNAVLVTK